MDMCTLTHPSIHTYIHIHAYACIHTYTQICVHTTCMRADIHTNMHTHTHTHKHTHTQTRFLSLSLLLCVCTHIHVHVVYVSTAQILSALSSTTRIYVSIIARASPLPESVFDSRVKLLKHSKQWGKSGRDPRDRQPLWDVATPLQRQKERKRERDTDRKASERERDKDRPRPSERGREGGRECAGWDQTSKPP